MHGEPISSPTSPIRSLLQPLSPSPEKRRQEAITAATCLTEALVDHLNVGYEPPPSTRSLHPPWLDRVWAIVLRDPGAPVTPVSPDLPLPPHPTPPNVTSWRLESAVTPKQLQRLRRQPEFPLPTLTSLAPLDAIWPARFTLFSPAVTWVGGKASLSHHIAPSLPHLLLSGKPGKQLVQVRKS